MLRSLLWPCSSPAASHCGRGAKFAKKQGNGNRGPTALQIPSFPSFVLYSDELRKPHPLSLAFQSASPLHIQYYGAVPVSLVQGLAEVRMATQRQNRGSDTLVWVPWGPPSGRILWRGRQVLKTCAIVSNLRARSAPQLKEGLEIVNRQRSSSVKKETR